MAGSLALETTLKNLLTEQDMPVDFFVALLNGAISGSRLRLALSGVRDFEHGHCAAVQFVLDALRQLVNEHEPVLLRWSNPKVYKPLLDAAYARSRLRLALSEQCGIDVDK